MQKSTNDKAIRKPNNEKTSAALNSVIAAFFLTGMKVVVGLLTGSLGILAEALHSAFDLVAAGVTFFAVRLSGRPADRKHQYGHGKIENLSALFETFLLFITCIWIIYEAIERLFFHIVPVEASIWAFIVMSVSIIVDYSRSRMLSKVAKKFNSQALAADALHFSTDIWSSAVVIVGLFSVWFAKYSGIKWLAKADAVAALGVSAIVLYVCFDMGKQTIEALLDGVSNRLTEDVSAAAACVPGVMKVNKLRVRQSGSEVFADLVLMVGRDTDLKRSHEIAHEAKQAVRNKLALPYADIMIHVEPSDPDKDGTLETVRVLAACQELSAHNIRIRNVKEQLLLELHLGIPDKFTVNQAHARATSFEDAVRKTFPTLSRINTHLEPIISDGDCLTSQANDLEIKQIVEEVCAHSGIACLPHEVESIYEGGELCLSFHCTLAGEMSVTHAHDFTEQLEKGLRSRISYLGNVMIHIEPFESAG
jgi:cation diffusion facilitator family transporter